MEPITGVIIGTWAWENFGKSVLDEAKTQYAQKILKKIDSIFPFKKKELEVIEAKIVDADENEIFKDEKSLIEFFENNQKINEVINQLNRRETNINIKVKKGVGYIDKIEGDLNIS